MSLLSSRMDVRGHVLFDRNAAVFGAGVAMAGRSLVSWLHGGGGGNNLVSRWG